MKIVRPLYAIIFFVIIYITGIIGLSIDQYQPRFSGLTPINLLISAIVLFLFHEKWKTRDIAAFWLVLAGGFAIELLGVKTNFIFGNYHYGNALGPEVSGTPLIIGLNWLILIYMAYVITNTLNLHSIGQAILGAFLLTGFELALEPVAVQLDFWYWPNGIPLQNFLAWWIISFIFLLSWRAIKIKATNSLAKYLFLIQFIFFLILNFTL